MTKSYNLEDILAGDENSFDEWLEEEFSSSPEDKIEEEDKEDNTEDLEDLLVEPDIPDDMNDIEKDMARTIYRVDRRSWEKGTGLKTGFKLFDEYLNGIQPSLGLLGADSNVGKSTALLSIGFNTAIHDDAYTLYFSLDDDVLNLLPRIIAMNKTIPINAIRLPKRFKDYPSILKKRKEGIKELYNLVDKFKIIDEEKAQGMETIKKIIDKHYDYAQQHNKKLFVLIDNFHDLYYEEQDFYDENVKFAEIAKELKNWTKELQIPIWCTAEVRKINSFRRPVMDDVKFASKIKYEASLILMAHNDVGLQGENATVYYRNPDKPGKSPVIELAFNKNKLSTYKGRVYFEFIPEYAHIIECDENDMERYNQLVYQSEN